MLPIGKGKLIREGKDLTIVALGHSLFSALKAAEILSSEGIDCAVINALFAKPLDSELIISQVEKTCNLLTIEENTLCGGFGSAVSELVNQSGLPGIKIRFLGLPDCFIEHGPQELFRSLFNLDSEGIVQYIRSSYPELFSGSSVQSQEGL
ncbi:MAG: hypothetical protein NUV31_01380 [Dehalococcoidales bacterium]|nr:hypothetical protein [Dehalococcoidales bacterium]